MFRRIAAKNQDSGSPQVGVVKASTTITHEGDMEATVEDVEVFEKYGGTFGNDLSISIRVTSIAIWIDIYLNNTIIEQKKLVSIKSEESEQDLADRIIKAFDTITFDRVEFNVKADKTKLKLQNVQKQKLTGGKDFTEGTFELDNVPAEIAKSYNFIKDKILYQPKFLTAGGFYDNEGSFDADESIVKAMMNLSLQRQDCRALIDLPMGTSAEDSQELASQIAYEQTANDQPIPSASVCAPWVYMQVGNTQCWMPPSYAYLMVVGTALQKGGKAYTPKAGLSNGIIPGVIRPEFEIGSDLLEQWQSDTAVQINQL